MKSSSVITVERLNDTAANRRNEVSLKLDHVHATLDLLRRAVTLENGENGDLDNLCVGTLEGAIDGLMREVAEVQECINGLSAQEG